MGKKKRQKRRLKPSSCYLCGKWCETPTVDHVPPSCLAPDASQSQFIQVPACKDCNNHYQQKESRFRDYSVFITKLRGSNIANPAYTKFQRSISRNEEGRAGRPHKDLQRLLDSIIEVFHADEQGKLFARSRHFTTAQDDFYEFEIFIKIARGIHYHYSKTVIPAGQQIYVYRMDTNAFSHLIEQRNQLYYRRMGDFFTYVGGYDQNQPANGVWAMNLYGELIVAVSFESEERPLEILRSPLELPAASYSKCSS